MKKILLIIFLSIMVAGCFTTKPNPILTSKDESWYIPKGCEFKAQKTEEEELKTYKAEDDLMVLYLGSYLELEKKANACIK